MTTNATSFLPANFDEIQGIPLAEKRVVNVKRYLFGCQVLGFKIFLRKLGLQESAHWMECDGAICCSTFDQSH
jgi:hypothetical protein